MGKKHKKESKKKKHRSKSRSRSRSNDREIEREKRRHHKRHHKDRKRDKACKRGKSDISSISDDDIIEIIDDVAPPPPKISKTGGSPSPPPPPRISSPPPPPEMKVEYKENVGGGGGGESLSIEETNRLRAKLGLKPLQPAGAPSNDDSRPGGSEDNFIHKPAEDLTNKKVTEKLRTRLAERKEKREIERKLMKVKGIAEDSEEEDNAVVWVKKSRKLHEEKLLAERKAKELDEMDKEFGIGELIQEELQKEKLRVYTATDLRGLTVEHDITKFDEGRAIILTLKDKGVLDEAEDALVNTNMLDDERYKKNILNRKQNPFGYNAIDTGEDDEDFGDKKVLSKYDEEIEGVKKSSFKLGQSMSEELMKEMVKKKLAVKAKMSLESLALPELKIASDYFTEEELKAKFKKPRKVKKIRKKMLKPGDLVTANGIVDDPKRDHGSRGYKNEEESTKNEIKDEVEEVEDPMDIDDLPSPPSELENLKLEMPEEESELELALKKARRLKQLEGKQATPILPLADLVKKEVEKEGMTIGYLGDEGPGGGGKIVLNSTAEFCRTLGDIPTYGLAGNRGEEAQGLLDFERDLKQEKTKQEETGDRGGWNDVEMDEKLVEIGGTETVILEAEPEVGAGIGGALRLAMSKGYLERGATSRPSASRFPHLHAQNYSIEDKTHVDEEKFGRRERYMGPTSDFKEKDNYKPNIKLEYIDDEGHLLSAKEAFRYLSHKFHGKGPGKNKVEKRMKKGEQQVLMKQMSSTDTPLGTLQMLQQKQKDTQSPFVVLSGSKHLPIPTSISKAKLTK